MASGHNRDLVVHDGIVMESTKTCCNTLYTVVSLKNQLQFLLGRSSCLHVLFTRVLVDREKAERMLWWMERSSIFARLTIPD